MGPFGDCIQFSGQINGEPTTVGVDRFNPAFANKG
jgi:hypothetical protein